ncbi:MAG: Crp/Fnr family transcriptional regulator [Deltaproteobacteria bacterium]|nr:Crp/Fnr family transcriptional regulator [Deltaproteobacteria bacterium]
MNGTTDGEAYATRRRDDPTRFIPWLRDHSPAFQSIPAAVLQQFFERSEIVSCKRDDSLLEQGQRADRIFVVISGTVTVRVERGGIIRELMSYGPGEVAGLLALVDQRDAPYEIRAASETEVVAVDARYMAQLRAAFHPTGMVVLDAFMPMLVEHLRQLDDRAIRLAARKSAAMSGTGQTFRRDDR